MVTYGITFRPRNTNPGPGKIYFSQKTFERKYVSSQKAYKDPCKAKYTTYPSSSDGHGDDWAPYAVFYSQLIAKPQPTVQATLQTRVPQQAILDNIDRTNPNDIVVAYRVVQKEDRRDLLRYILLRALKQSDQTVRIYQFEMVMQADTHYLDRNHRGESEWKPYNPHVPQTAYEHFNRVVVQNRAHWLKAMQLLDTQD